jgi:hypothetical protein
MTSHRCARGTSSGWAAGPVPAACLAAAPARAAHQQQLSSGVLARLTAARAKQHPVLLRLLLAFQRAARPAAHALHARLAPAALCRCAHCLAPAQRLRCCLLPAGSATRTATQSCRRSWRATSGCHPPGPPQMQRRSWSSSAAGCTWGRCSRCCATRRRWARGGGTGVCRGHCCGAAGPPQPAGTLSPAPPSLLRIEAPPVAAPLAGCPLQRA